MSRKYSDDTNIASPVDLEHVATKRLVRARKVKSRSTRRARASNHVVSGRDVVIVIVLVNLPNLAHARRVIAVIVAHDVHVGAHVRRAVDRSRESRPVGSNTAIEGSATTCGTSATR